MKKKIIKLLMKVYLSLRKLWDPLKRPSKVLDEYKRDMLDFSKRINSFEYKYDPLKGLIDHTADPNLFFDDTRESGRDCDDFQRQWSWWGVYNGYKAYEYVICEPTTIKNAFSTMHVIGTLYKEDNKKWFLTNYRSYGPFVTEEEALNYMTVFKDYTEDCVIVKYREVK